MNLDTLKQIVKLAKEEGVTDLKVELKDFKVEVSFSSGAISPMKSIHSVQSAAQSSVSESHSVQAAPKAQETDSRIHVITSPFVGTFYSSPGPGKPIYTKLGERVKVGQVLCVLEAMKIMNEIDSDVNGEVVEICVENESLVEYGQPLFKIKLHS